jgi:hypothetical protein
MRRRFILLVFVVCVACEQRAERTIPYRADVPIAERLEPGDTTVVVQMKMPEPPPLRPDASGQESFEQEIQRLKTSEIIAVIRVTATEGEIADRGTWVRTRVTAAVDRIVHAPPQRRLGESLEFTYGGGSARIGQVEVSTGKFPVFVQGDRYLMFLSTRPGTADWLIWNGIAFRVDAQDLLQRVSINGGGEQLFRTNLVGRTVTDVADALAR